MSREHLRISIAVLTGAPVLWLTWLAFHGRPLPMADLGSAALVGAVFCLGTSAIVLWVRGLPLLSFPSLFLGVTFLFTCSPLILYGIEGEAAFRAWEYVDLPSVLRAIPIVMLAFAAFALGALLLPLRPSRAVAPATVPAGDADGAEPTPRERALRAVGIGVYALAAALVAISSVLNGTGPLSYALEGGYSAYHGAKRAGQISQLVGVSVAHLLPWALLILVATSRSRRQRLVAVGLAVPFILLMLSVGDRGGPIATMAILASGLSLVGARVGLWRSLAVLLLIAFLIPTILNLRQLPISEWSGTAIAEAASNQVEATNTYGSGPATGFLVAMSSPYQTLMATVDVVPAIEGYHMGGDYLSALVVAVPFRSRLLPFVGAEVNRVPPSQWVLNYLHPGRRAGPGYLQVAEAYLEFGAIGVLGLYVFMGWALTRLWGAMVKRSGDALALAFALIAMMETLLWVRNSASLFVRAVAWGFVFVYLIPTLLGRSERVRRRAAGVRPSPVP